VSDFRVHAPPHPLRRPIRRPIAAAQQHSSSQDNDNDQSITCRRTHGILLLHSSPRGVTTHGMLANMLTCRHTAATALQDTTTHRCVHTYITRHKRWMQDTPTSLAMLRVCAFVLCYVLCVCVCVCVCCVCVVCALCVCKIRVHVWVCLYARICLCTCRLNLTRTRVCPRKGSSSSSSSSNSSSRGRSSSSTFCAMSIRRCLRAVCGARPVRVALGLCSTQRKYTRRNHTVLVTEGNPWEREERRGEAGSREQRREDDHTISCRVASNIYIYIYICSSSTCTYYRTCVCVGGCDA
jgi:hypothetical protein